MTSTEHIKISDIRTVGVPVTNQSRSLDFVPPMFTFRDPDGNRLVVVQQGT